MLLSVKVISGPIKNNYPPKKIITQNLQEWIEQKPDGNKLGNKWEVSSVKSNLVYFSKSLYRKRRVIR